MTGDERTGYRSGDRAAGVGRRVTPTAPATPKTGAAPRAGEAAADPHCERCGAAMIDRHCKLVCTRCGYQRDCSDP